MSKSGVINMSYCVYFTECFQWTVSSPPNYLWPEQQTVMPSCCRLRYSVTKVKYGDSFLYGRSEEASWVADRTIGKFSAGWSPEHSSSTLNGCLLLLDRTAARICGSDVARANFWRTFLGLANSRERGSSWELTVMYLVEKWMKPKTSFPKSQKPTRERYPEARWSHYNRLSSSFKIRFNVTLYAPRSPKWSLPFRFSDPILYAVLPSRALHVSTPLKFLNFVAPVTFFEGWNYAAPHYTVSLIFASGYGM